MEDKTWEKHLPENSRWMENSAKEIADVPLGKILLPGTHSSASTSIEPQDTFTENAPQNLKDLLNSWSFLTVLGSAAKNISSKWVKTQEKTIYKQLMDGVRSLDIHLCHNAEKNEFFVAHSFYGESFVSTLRQVRNFIEFHTKEILIINIDLYGNDEDLHTKLFGIIVDAWGHKILPYVGEKVLDYTINDIWKLDKQIILFCDSQPESNVLCWPNKLKASYNTSDKHCETAQELLPKLERSVKKIEKNKLYFLEGYITPSLNMIQSKLSTKTTLLELSKDVSKSVCDLLRSQWRDKNINVVSIDAYDSTSIIHLIVEINKERYWLKHLTQNPEEHKNPQLKKVSATKKDVWGISTEGKLLRRQNSQTWLWYGGNDIVDISVSKDSGVWILKEDGSLWVFMNGWNLFPSPGNLKRISSPIKGIVLGLDKNNRLLQYSTENSIWIFYSNTKLLFREFSVSKDGNVWAISPDGKVWQSHIDIPQWSIALSKEDLQGALFSYVCVYDKNSIILRTTKGRTFCYSQHFKKWRELPHFHRDYSLQIGINGKNYTSLYGLDSYNNFWGVDSED